LAIPRQLLNENLIPALYLGPFDADDNTCMHCGAHFFSCEITKVNQTFTCNACKNGTIQINMETVQGLPRTDTSIFQRVSDPSSQQTHPLYDKDALVNLLQGNNPKLKLALARADTAAEKQQAQTALQTFNANSRFFRNNIRIINNALAMCVFSLKRANVGTNFSPCFRAFGDFYIASGGLRPPTNGNAPRFLEIHVWDGQQPSETQIDIDQRTHVQQERARVRTLNCLRNPSHPDFNQMAQCILLLQVFLQHNNKLLKEFATLYDLSLNLQDTQDDFIAVDIQMYDGNLFKRMIRRGDTDIHRGMINAPRDDVCVALPFEDGETLEHGQLMALSLAPSANSEPFQFDPNRPHVRLHVNCNNGLDTVPSPQQQCQRVPFPAPVENCSCPACKPPVINPTRVNMRSNLALPMKYPLLFPHGTPCWDPTMMTKATENKPAKKLSLLAWTRYLLYTRMSKKQSLIAPTNQQNSFFTLLFCSSQLFHEFVIICFLACEAQRYEFYYNNQNNLRSSTYNAMLNRPRTDTAQNIGIPKIILPKSHIGSPAQMKSLKHHAVAIAKAHGKCSYFITMTANASWKEITENLCYCQTSADRADLVLRVFRAKLSHLIAFLDDGFLGKSTARIWVQEYQGRDLPHAHILLWIAPDQRPSTPDDFDRVVCSEIPDESREPHLHDLVLRHMIHRPCDGSAMPVEKCSCYHRLNQQCMKRFPKDFTSRTHMEPESNYVHYRRRSPHDGGVQCGFGPKSNRCHIDNRWVVPYNPALLLIFECHINVEILAETFAGIKYLFDYVTKGGVGDFAVYNQTLNIPRNVRGQQVYDTIRAFRMSRIIGPHHALSRLMSYSMSDIRPAVMDLPIHLEHQQNIIFKPTDTVNQILNRQTYKDSKLMNYFRAVQQSRPTLLNRSAIRPAITASSLKYAEMPLYFTWTEGAWRARVRISDVIPRIQRVNLHSGEIYFLRLLLENHVASSFTGLRGTFDSYRARCLAEGLIQNDQYFINVMDELIADEFSSQIRVVFSQMLFYNNPSNALQLYEAYKAHMCVDYSRARDSALPDALDYNQLLHELDIHLKSIGQTQKPNICTASYDLPAHDPNMPNHPSMNNTPSVSNLFTIYNRREQSELAVAIYGRLNNEQKAIFTQVTLDFTTMYQHTQANDARMPAKIHIIEAPAGTGKTYLLQALIAFARGQDEARKVLISAPTGLAASALPGAQTAHSLYSIPLGANMDDVSRINAQSPKASILAQAVLICFEEAFNTNKSDINVIDKLLQDLKHSKYSFGGNCVVVMCGCPRQLVPVVPHAPKAASLASLLYELPIYDAAIKHTLKTNMRVETFRQLIANESSVAAATSAANDLQAAIDTRTMLLRIGNDSAPKPFEQLNSDEADGFDAKGTFLPAQIVFQRAPVPANDTADLACQRMFDDCTACLKVAMPFLAQGQMPTSFQQASSLYGKRVVLCNLNTETLYVTRVILDIMRDWQGFETQTYYSCDETDQDDHSVDTASLHDINKFGLPPHELILFLYAPIIFTMSIDNIIVNGVTGIITKLHDYSVEVTITKPGPTYQRVVTVTRKRISVPPKTSHFPFTFYRTQFPLKMAFALTTHKCQGLSCSFIMVFLASCIFSYGALYSMLSRCGDIRSILVYIEPNVKQGYSFKHNAYFTVNDVAPKCTTLDLDLAEPYPDYQVPESQRPRHRDGYMGGPVPAQKTRLRRIIESHLFDYPFASVTSRVRDTVTTTFSFNDDDEDNNVNVDDHEHRAPVTRTTTTTRPTASAPDIIPSAHHSETSAQSLSRLYLHIDFSNYIGHNLTCFPPIHPPSYWTNRTYSWLYCALMADALLDIQFPFTRTVNFLNFTFEFNGTELSLSEQWPNWTARIKLAFNNTANITLTPLSLYWPADQQEALFNHAIMDVVKPNIMAFLYKLEYSN